MKNKYFGTDGIRGVFGESLTEELAFKTGRAIVKYFGAGVYVVARDSRLSGTALEQSLVNGIAKENGNALCIGILPTPAAAVITKLRKAVCGIVISASHNPPKYNGIKLFDSTGMKLSEEKENEIEQIIDSLEQAKETKISYKTDAFAKEDYINYVTSGCKDGLNGITVRLDCCYGATAIVAAEIFERLGAKVFAYNNVYDGSKINVGVGALHPEWLLEKMEDEAEAGLCFDGDGDRVAIILDKEIIDGDSIIYNMSKSLKLNKNTVVGTILNNLALENALKNDGVKLERVSVGDKYISNRMTEKGYSLGGEQSGHFIINTFCATGDAILSGVYLLSSLKKNGKISKPIKLELVPQAAISIPSAASVVESEGMKKLKAEAEKLLTGKGRVIIRMSGTEPNVRVMVECTDSHLVKDLLDKFTEYIKKYNAN